MPAATPASVYGMPSPAYQYRPTSNPQWGPIYRAPYYQGAAPVWAAAAGPMYGMPPAPMHHYTVPLPIPAPARMVPLPIPAADTSQTHELSSGAGKHADTTETNFKNLTPAAKFLLYEGSFPFVSK